MTGSGYKLHYFGSLKRGRSTGRRAGDPLGQYAAIGTHCADIGIGAEQLGVECPVATGHAGRHLPCPARNSADNTRPVCIIGTGRYKMFAKRRVGCLDNDIVTAEQSRRIIFAEAPDYCSRFYSGIEPHQFFGEHLSLVTAQYIHIVGHLTLQVMLFDNVKIDYIDYADSGTGEVQRHCRSERTCAYHEHTRVTQACLSFITYFGQRNRTRITPPLFFTKPHTQLLLSIIKEGGPQPAL